MLGEAIACGVIASLTWAGLVWLSPELPIQQGRTWIVGIGLFATVNALAWIVLSLLNWKFLWLWTIVFAVVNAIASRSLPTQIPPWWASLWHPLAITTMTILLAGSLGAV
jgi:hypothetical protein